MTPQETFDFVARALVAQGKPAITDHTCCYRGDNNTRCAVGHLIPDDRYHPGLERRMATDRELVDILCDLGHSVDLCARLQSAHDSADDDERVWLKEWAERMRGVADEFKLSTSALDEALAARKAGT